MVLKAKGRERPKSRESSGAEPHRTGQMVVLGGFFFGSWGLGGSEGREGREGKGREPYIRPSGLNRGLLRAPSPSPPAPMIGGSLKP